MSTIAVSPLVPLDPYTCTDLGNARRFADQHSPGILYCKAWKKWLIFEGTRWEVDGTDLILRLARETVRSIYTEAGKAEEASERKALSDHARRSEAEARLRSMVSLAQSEAGIPVRVEDLDADPMKFNVANGTIDLLTGELLPHSYRDKITKLAPVTYDPEATAPAWDAFLQTIFAGSENMIRFLQRGVGYTLTGNVSEQILLLLWGTGANGKTTLLEALRFIFGDYAMAAAFATFTLQGDGVRNDIARLKGARLVSATEGSDGQRLDEALVKQLTGGDTIAARHLYAEHFEFKPAFKIWLATNHKPRIKETGIAIWRRVKLIPFTVTIPEPEQDKGLIDKLLAEAPGILNWAIKGGLEWRQKGLGVPDEVQAATRQYKDEEDPISPFLAECCTIGPREGVTLKAMYERYRVWCEASGERELKKKGFQKSLEEKGFDSYRGAKGAVTFMGIGLER